MIEEKENYVDCSFEIMEIAETNLCEKCYYYKEYDEGQKDKICDFKYEPLKLVYGPSYYQFYLYCPQVVTEEYYNKFIRKDGE